MTARRPRVLVVAHGHPDQSPGGGEIAAHAQHLALRASAELDSVFLARHDDAFPIHEGTAFGGNRRPAEILFHSSLGDRFLFAQRDPSRVWQHFREALEIVRPDVVHFHHYLHLGLEMLGEVRRLSPRVAIALTLHDFHAPCHNEGTMVKVGSGALCRRAEPEACRGCFPSRSAQDFMLRERHVKGWLGLVDRFVAPSRFLADRYVEWGIDPARIEVLENLLGPAAGAHVRPVGSGGSDADPGGTEANADGPAPHAPAPPPRGPGDPLRLAFFGRINGVKGVDLLLEAMRRLPPEVAARTTLDVHGAGLERQPALRRLALRRAANRLGPTVRLRGPYAPAEVPALMREAHWMVVPSRWWENSPVVILEARRHGLPVIAADVGGMAEKVEHGVTGLHFRANDARALAARIVEAEASEPLRERCARAMRASFDAETVRARHLALHLELAAGEHAAAGGTLAHTGSVTPVDTGPGAAPDEAIVRTSPPARAA